MRKRLDYSENDFENRLKMAKAKYEANVEFIAFRNN